MIRAVAFDLWETLVTDTPELSKQQERLRLDAVEKELIAHGRPLEAERIDKAYRTMWRRCQELYWSADVDITCRRQVEHFIEELGLESSSFDERTLERLEHSYATAAIEVLPAIVDGAVETIRALRDQGLRIGLISNTGRTPGYALREILDRLELGPSIDAMVFSNEHGFCKPKRSIFEELQRGLDVPFEETVFVGDNPYADVHGAQSCGMRGVLFVPAAKGTAVAPPIEHGLTIVPDAVVHDLRDLIGLVAGLSG